MPNAVNDFPDIWPAMRDMFMMSHPEIDWSSRKMVFDRYEVSDDGWRHDLYGHIEPEIRHINLIVTVSADNHVSAENHE